MRTTVFSVRAAFFALVFSALRILSFAEDTKTINGQVFVRTEGGETIKLSLVEVHLFDEKTIADDLQKKIETAKPIYEYLQSLESTFEEKLKSAQNAETKANNDADQDTSPAPVEQALAKEKVARAHMDTLMARIAYDMARGLADYTHSSFYYFGTLPKPLQTVKTDADGKFIFKVPPGSYVLVAQSIRNAEKEVYNWMVRVSVDNDQMIMLANDNLSSSASQDSLVRTPIDEAYIALAMTFLSSTTRGSDIHTLSSYIDEWVGNVTQNQVPTTSTGDIHTLSSYIDEDIRKKKAEAAEEEAQDAAAKAAADAQEAESRKQNEEAARQAAKQEFQRKLAAGQIQVPLVTAVEIPGQYGNITLPKGTQVTVLAIQGDSLRIRSGAYSLTVPAKDADTSTFK